MGGSSRGGSVRGRERSGRRRMTGSAPCAGRCYHHGCGDLSSILLRLTQTLCQVLIFIYTYRFERGGPGGRGRTGFSLGTRVADSSLTPDFDECFTFWSHPRSKREPKMAPKAGPCATCAQSVHRALRRPSPEPSQSLSRASPEPLQRPPREVRIVRQDLWADICC